MSVSVVLQPEDVQIPAWVVDLASFQRWVESDDFPEQGRICYFQGEVWVDRSEQQIFTHVRVKTEFGRVLGNLEKSDRRGFFLADGLRVSHAEADLSSVPDGTFILNESMAAGRVRLIAGAEAGFVRVEGSPDSLLEVISDSSVRKDTVRLRQLYWEAGVREYWLVDARQEPLTFDILRHTAKGYVAIRKQGGWLKSAVFGKSFRLLQQTDRFGHPTFTLEVR